MKRTPNKTIDEPKRSFCISVDDVDDVFFVKRDDGDQKEKHRHQDIRVVVGGHTQTINKYEGVEMKVSVTGKDVVD